MINLIRLALFSHFSHELSSLYSFKYHPSPPKLSFSSSKHSPLSQQFDIQTQYSQILQDLSKLNQEKNITNFEQTFPEEKNEILKSEGENQSSQDTEKYKKYDKTKSVIFNNFLIQERSLTDPKLQLNSVKIFFFNSPFMKVIPYGPKSTVKSIIKKALEIYCSENLDSSKLLRPVDNYQMRLPQGDKDFRADLSLQAIHPQRLLSENLFECLVLVEKTKLEDSYVSKPTQENSQIMNSFSPIYSFRRENSLMDHSQKITLVLMDDTYYELARVEVDKSGTLEKIFRLIDSNNLNQCRNYILKEDPDSQYDLTAEYEVRNLQSTRLYKKFMDQGDDDIDPRPIRLKTLLTPQEPHYLPPIGINEASRYEEFEVTKISTIGIACERILGIDQTKIYNYDKQMRKEKKEISLMDKFLGADSRTGTKKPFRLIKELREIKKFQGGLQLVFHDKTTTLLIKSEVTQDKIYRKLSFLLQYYNKPTDTWVASSPHKKKSLLFKF